MKISSKRFLVFISSLPIVISFFLANPLIVMAETEPASTLKEKKAQEGYILNLQDLIKESKKKIEKVNDKLKEQAVKRRNQQREEKAREYYDKGNKLAEEGKLTEAKEYWNKAIQIMAHPEMKNYISENVSKTKKLDQAFKMEEDRRIKRLEIERGYSAAEVEAAYQKAIAFYKEKKYVESKDEFGHVEDMFPDFKATRSYLMLIDQVIQEEQQALIDQRLKEDAIAKRKEKELWQKDVETQERERRKNLENQAETLFQEARQLYKIREFEKAKEKFKQVEYILPDYKSTTEYLSHIDRDIEQESKYQALRRKREVEEEKVQGVLSAQKQTERARRQKEIEEQDKIKRIKDEAEFVYQSAVLLFKKEQYDLAQEKFLEVQKIDPTYKESKKYLQRIDEKMADKKYWGEQSSKEVNAINVPDDKKLESLYQSAIVFYNKKQLEEANEVFTYIQSVKPGYKATIKYLTLLQEKIPPISTPKSASMTSDPQMKVIEDIAAKNNERKNQAEPIYQTAIAFYKNGLYQRSKQEFQKINNLVPGYKETKSYLKKIDQALDREIEQSTKKKPAAVRSALIADEQDLLVKKAMEERKKRMEDQAKTKYKEATDLYKEKNYAEAKVKFIEVEALYPSFKDTLKYLARIDDDINDLNEKGGKGRSNIKQKPWDPSLFETKVQQIDSCENCAQADLVYRDALTCYQNGQWTEAREKFIAVDRLVANYKSTKTYLSDVSKKINSRENCGREDGNCSDNVAVVQQPKDQFEEAASEIYRQAENNFFAKNYKAAQSKFIEVERLYPNYKDTQKYLKKLQSLLELPGEPYTMSASAENEKLANESKSTVTIKEIPEPKEVLPVYDGRLAKMKFDEDLTDKDKRKSYLEYRKQIRFEEALRDKQERERKQGYERRKQQLMREYLLAQKERARAEAGKRKYELKLQKELEKKEAVEQKARMKEEKEKERQKQIEEQARLKKEKEEALAKAKEEKEREDQQKAEIEARVKEEVEDRIKAEAKAKAEEMNLSSTQEVEPDEEAEIITKSNVSVSDDRAQKSPSRSDLNKIAALEEIKLEISQQKAKRELSRIRREENQQLFEKNRKLKLEQARIKKRLEQQEKESRRDWTPGINKIYLEAIRMYKEKNYSGARSKFNMVEAMSPDYRGVRYYLDLLSSRVELEKQRIEDQARADHIRKEKEARLQKESEEREKLRKEREEAQKKAIEEKEKIRKEKEEAKKKALEEKEKQRLEKEEAKKKALEEKEKQRLEKEESEKKERAELKQKQEESKNLPSSSSMQSLPEEIVDDKKNAQVSGVEVNEESMKALSPEQLSKAQEEKSKIDKEEAKKREKILAAIKKREEKDKQRMARFEEKARQQKVLEEEREARKREKEESRQRKLEAKNKREEAAKLAMAKEAPVPEVNTETTSPAASTAEILAQKTKEIREIQKRKEAQDRALEKQRMDFQKEEEISRRKEAEIRRQKDREKEEKRVREEKKKARLAKEIEEAQLKKMKAKLDQSFEIVLEALKTGNESDIMEKSSAFEQIIRDESVPTNYAQTLNLKYLKEKERWQTLRLAEEKKRKELARREEELKERIRKQQEEIKQRELDEMQKRIQMQEQQLAKEKEAAEAKARLEEERVQKLKEKEAFEKLNKEKMAKQKAMDDELSLLRQSPTEDNLEQVKRKQQLRDLEKSKQKEVENLVKSRQEELRIERERIRKEFDQSIETLYVKAVKLYDSGNLDQSFRIFSEIDHMKPEYKKTKSYLKLIQRNKEVPVALPRGKNEILTTKTNQAAPANRGVTRQKIIAESLDAFEKKL